MVSMLLKCEETNHITYKLTHLVVLRKKRDDCFLVVSTQLVSYGRKFELGRQKNIKKRP